MQRHGLFQSNSAALFCAAVCAALFLCTTQLHAQNAGFTSTPGNRHTLLHGDVRNATGEPVKDAQVELRTLAGRTLSSVAVDNSGSFQFADLESGWYELVASSGAEQSVTTINISSLFPEPVTIRLGSARSASNSEAAVSVNSLTIPSKARDAFEAADRLFQKNDVTGAWKKIEKALQSSPKYAAALTLRGLLKMSTNQPQQALQDFAAALQADRGYQLAYAALAAGYNSLGQFDEALRVLDQGNSLSMQSWQAHLEASKALLGKKSFGRALQEANQASSLLGRDFPMINVVKANAYLGLQDTSSAASELRLYLQRESDGPLADKVRGILAKIGK